MIGRASAWRAGSLFIFKHLSPQFLNSHLLLMATRVFSDRSSYFAVESLRLVPSDLSLKFSFLLLLASFSNSFRRTITIIMHNLKESRMVLSSVCIRVVTNADSLALKGSALGEGCFLLRRLPLDRRSCFLSMR
jgi:hypothetical protein